jgi:hypothetical protein
MGVLTFTQNGKALQWRSSKYVTIYDVKNGGFRNVNGHNPQCADNGIELFI